MPRAELTHVKDLVVNRRTVLGTGAGGPVYLGTAGGRDVAAKQFMRHDSYSFSHVMAEAEKLASIRHENIVEFIGIAFSTDGWPEWIVTEKADCSLLQRLEHQNFHLPLHQALPIFRQVAAGLAFLHGYLIIHRDIKPANILLFDHNVAKICDFGITRFCETASAQQMTRSGTPSYVAPEVLSGHYDIKVDIFSFGQTMVESLLTSDALGLAQTRRHEVLRDQLSNVQSQRAQLVNLILRCVDYDPHNRPDAQQLHEELDSIAKSLE